MILTKNSSFQIRFRSFIKGILLATFLFQTEANGQITQPDSVIIQQLIHAQIGEDIPGILLGIEHYGSLGRQWSGSYNDVQHKTLLNPDQTFRIASVNNTFVAVAIIRLWEEGKLNLDDPISNYLCEDHLILLRKGGYDPSIITIRHLLHHNLGMADHAHTAAYDVNVLRPGYKWTRPKAN